MDVLLIMLFFVYIAQGILLFLTRFFEYKKLVGLFAALVFAFIIYLVNSTLFMYLLVFYLIFFSRTCRPSDYGFSYHFTLIIAMGFAHGPVAGLIFGFLPTLLVPYIRPDMQIIDIILSSILLTLAGIASGIAGYFFPHLNFVMFALITLAIFNIARFFALFGKIPLSKTSIFLFVNIGMNAYLIWYYLAKLMVWMGHVPK